MAPTMVSLKMVLFDLAFNKLSESIEKFTFFTVIKGNKVIGFWMVNPREVHENYEPP